MELASIYCRLFISSLSYNNCIVGFLCTPPYFLSYNFVLSVITFATQGLPWPPPTNFSPVVSLRLIPIDADVSD